jgi:hypothetical protein
MYFETNNINMSLEGCSFASNYAGMVKKKLASFIEKRLFDPFLTLYIRPSPLAGGCLGACGQPRTAGVFCSPLLHVGKTKSTKAKVSSYFFYLNRAFLTTPPPFFSIFRGEE